MKVWRIQYSYDDCGSGIRQEWFSSKAEAKKRLREAKETKNDPLEGIEQLELPTNKRELIRFLNRYAEIC